MELFAEKLIDNVASISFCTSQSASLLKLIQKSIFVLTLNRPGGGGRGGGRITSKIVQLAKQAYRYVNKILFCTF